MEFLNNGSPVDPRRARINIVGGTWTDSASDDWTLLTLQVGDITSVVAGAGLTGGGTSGAVTLTVGAGNGITVNADDVALNLAYSPIWTGNHTHTPAAASSGVPTALTINGAADTAQTASTEKPLVNINGARTVQWATGALTTQREVLIQAPTYAFVGASTLTNAATFAISGAPAAGTNATITNAYSLWVQGGQTRLDGKVNLGQTTVSQGTNINTDVTANGASVVITTQAASTAAATFETGFTLNNTSITATSVVTATIVGYSGTYVTNGYPTLAVAAPGAGTVAIKVGNTHAANALSGTMKIHVTVL